MINVKKITFFYFTAIWILFMFGIMTWAIFGICLGVYFIAMVYGSFNIGSRFYLKTICRVKIKEKQLALTFDDGPDEDITPLILDILKEYNIKATFFIIGHKAAKNIELTGRIIGEGHIIGNHGFSHSNWFGFWSAKKVKEDILITNKFIEENFERKMLYFRPPFGVTNPSIKKALKDSNYTVIGWSIRSLDTVFKDGRTIMKRLKSKLRPGSIVLFHDDRKITAEVLREFLEYIINNQYSIIPLDELTETKAYE